MTRILFAALAAILTLLTACRQSEEDHQDIYEYYTQLNDSIQARSMTHPEANLMFIDSLENNKLIPTAIADYFRANTYYAMNKKRVVEFYYKKALDEDRIFDVWPKAYYISCRNLSNNLRWKGDHDSALKYATEAFYRAADDPSPDARLNSPGLLMFIALCQHDLGYEEESHRNLENSYNMSRALAMEDSTFNTRYHFAMNTVSTLLTIKPETPLEEAEKWIKRTREAVSMLNPSNETDRYLTEMNTAIMNITIAKIDVQHGAGVDAEKTYREFLDSRFSKTDNGIMNRYRFLQSAERWVEAAALIPKVDSIREINDKVMNMEMLQNMHEEYEVFLHAGMPQQAQQRMERVMQCIDTVAKQQQLSVANEMSSIFETQLKEKKIAEQETALVRQRLFMLCVVMLLIVIFGAIFTYFMHIETKKAEREHRKLQYAYKQLTEANEKAEESSRMKSEFIRQISHEIRTPLNILSGYAQVITDEEYDMDEDTRKRANSDIVDNTNRITKLVNKMLELSELYASSGADPTVEIAVAAIVTKAIKETKIDRTQGIKFTVDLSQLGSNPSLLKIHTQERPAVRALSLILSNARKFTKAGSVRLIVSNDESKEHIKFTVEDTGKGVPAKEAERIFEEFVQLDEYVEGMGIGLTVARYFARRLGGDVVLDTSYTGGARFVLTIAKVTSDNSR